MFINSLNFFYTISNTKIILSDDFSAHICNYSNFYPAEVLSNLLLKVIELYKMYVATNFCFVGFNNVDHFQA